MSDTEITVIPAKRETIVLLLALDRLRPQAIAEALDVSLETVLAVTVTDAAQINAMRAQFPSAGDARQIIENDAEANVQWLRALRDGHLGANVKMLRVQARAAEVLLDRQVPKKALPNSNGPKPIEVTGEQVDRMKQLLGTADHAG